MAWKLQPEKAGGPSAGKPNGDPWLLGTSAPGRQAQKAAASERALPGASPALLHHGSLYHWQCGCSQGEPGQLPPTVAKGLTCQLSQFSAATAMGYSWKPPHVLIVTCCR